MTSVLAEPVITDIQVGETQITLNFTDDGSSNQFEIERNPNLNPANWSEDTSATRTDLGGGRFRYTLDRNAATIGFFHIIGYFLGTGLDRDGDGIPNAVEESFTGNTNSPNYSNPDDPDTDNDGFSDGVEFANGTKSNDASSKPDQATLPKVEFTSSISSAAEGDGDNNNDGIGEVTIPFTVTGGFTGTV